MTETAERLVRASAPRVMASRDGLDVVGRDASLTRLEGDSGALAEQVLAFCDVARTRAEIFAHVERLTGAPLGAGTGVLDALVTLLRDAGALAPATSTAPKTGGRVLIGMGGAIAAAHAPQLLARLLARGLEVRVVASERALRFVSREALEVLTHCPVLSTMWPEDAPPERRVPHIELAAWADVVVIWPATATMIHRIASGDCSELVSAVAIATRAPVLVAPSMNEAMLDAASVTRNLETLRADGFRIAGTALALEVAEAPGARTPMRGGGPDAATLAVMIEALGRAAAPRAPRDAAAWEAFHRLVPEAEQAWVAEADPIVLDLLDRHAKAGSLWDVGTGHGAIALAAAARGLRVVATDVSDTALARARERAGDAPIVWLRDDATLSVLRGSFDTVVDRGTLHVLRPDQRAAYARVVAARTRPGSRVIVTTHTPPGDPRVASFPMSAAEVAGLFGDAFEVLEAVGGTFAGSLTPPPACVTTVLRRR